MELTPRRKDAKEPKTSPIKRFAPWRLCGLALNSYAAPDGAGKCFRCDATKISPRTGLGSAPAPGAADDALVVGHGDARRPNHDECLGFARRVHREGAANDSRGGCAPQIVRRDAAAAGAVFS